MNPFRLIRTAYRVLRIWSKLPDADKARAQHEAARVRALASELRIIAISRGLRPEPALEAEDDELAATEALDDVACEPATADRSVVAIGHELQAAVIALAAAVGPAALDAVRPKSRTGRVLTRQGGRVAARLQNRLGPD